eukprot:363294-Chlamydomonas_euryale.AAC.5
MDEDGALKHVLTHTLGRARVPWGQEGRTRSWMHACVDVCVSALPRRRRVTISSELCGRRGDRG